MEQKPEIQIIGAGGIVKDAHLPAYRIAGYRVGGIFDPDTEKARKLAGQFNITRVHSRLEDLIRHADKRTVFDVAVPGNAVLSVLEQLPDETTVLIQKPMGNTLEEARAILDCCRKKRLKAGINFQLRYAPFVVRAREMVDTGVIGDLCDLEVNVNVFTPWNLWTFLNDLPRVEILYHSIHYIDLIRSFLGNPSGMYAKTTKHPKMARLASVRSNIIMDYGDMIRANILTNHTHEYGLKHQHSYIKWEGTQGAIRIEMGLLKNYPEGEPDTFEYIQFREGKEADWQEVVIKGSWFPHAFIGSMGEMIKVIENPGYVPDNSVEDCIHTMACVEAAYRSSAQGGVELG